MALTPEQNLKAEQAFAQSDEGGKGYLHSKEFFYACQALGFNYSFVECFEMYKIYDDNNSLRMNIDEFKRFYAAKLKDPASHVDPNRVTNVYSNRGTTNVGYIPNSTPATGVYTKETTTVTQSGPIGQTVVTGGAQTTSTTYQTGAVVSGGQTYVTTTNQPTYVTTGQQVLTTGGQQIVTSGGQQIVTSGGQQIVTSGGQQILTTGGKQILTNGQQIVTAADGTRRVIGGNLVTTGSHIVGQRLGHYTTAGSTLLVTGNEMSRYDTENKGWITKEQLRVACKDLAVKCDTDEELEAIWNEIDLNHTGRINSYEFGEFYDYVKGFRDLVRQKRA